MVFLNIFEISPRWKWKGLFTPFEISWRRQAVYLGVQQKPPSRCPPCRRNPVSCPLPTVSWDTLPCRCPFWILISTAPGSAVLWLGELLLPSQGVVKHLVNTAVPPVAGAVYRAEMDGMYGEVQNIGRFCRAELAGWGPSSTGLPRLVSPAIDWHGSYLHSVITGYKNYCTHVHPVLPGPVKQDQLEVCLLLVSLGWAAEVMLHRRCSTEVILHRRGFQQK